MKIRTRLATAAAVLLVGTLAACGGDDDSAAQTPAENVAPAASASGSEGSSDPQTPAADPDNGHGAGHSDSSPGGGATITMEGLEFLPAVLNVKAGETITIVNKDAARHDLTDDKTIDSGDIEGMKDGSVKAPTDAGEYPYKCTYHFGMEGTLKVS
ncbi:MAG: cupredoxin domain-containing protein [Sporichthyaceae bacterium]